MAPKSPTTINLPMIDRLPQGLGLPDLCRQTELHLQRPEFGPEEIRTKSNKFFVQYRPASAARVAQTLLVRLNPLHVINFLCGCSRPCA